MPDVGSYQFRGNDNATPNTTSWKPPVYVKAHDGTVSADASTWKYGKNVYYHTGSGWVEVWNARPEATSSTISFSSSNSTTINFSGSADPNNFSTTAKFEYREVGTSTWNDSSTTSTGMGNGVDGAVSFTATSTVTDGYKNWEARASATNTVGTGVGSTITKDCRQTGTPSWSATVSSTSVVTCSNCYGCGSDTRTDVTYKYTKDGCPDYYNTTTGSCSNGCGNWVPSTSDRSGEGLTYTGFYGYYTRNSFTCTCAENDPCYFPYQETVYVTVCSATGATNISSVSCDCYFGCGA